MEANDEDAIPGTDDSVVSPGDRGAVVSGDHEAHLEELAGVGGQSGGQGLCHVQED